MFSWNSPQQISVLRALTCIFLQSALLDNWTFWRRCGRLNVEVLTARCRPLCPFLLCLCSESAVREGWPDDGVVLPPVGRPDEWGQVPSLRQGPTQELLCHRHVHCPAAAEAVLRLQVWTHTHTLRTNHNLSAHLSVLSCPGSSHALSSLPHTKTLY